MKRQPARHRNRRKPAPKPTRTTSASAAAQPATSQSYEVETIVGLEEFARREIRHRLGKQARIAESQPLAGRISLTFDGDMRRFDALRTAAAVHRVETFAVPRPRALLGHQHLTRLLTAVRAVMNARPAGSFRTFRIAAAGAGSAVFARLRQEIAATAIESTDAAAHLHIAVRRAPCAPSGWQALIRTAAMPLSARRWRVRDMPGALNANIAATMVSLAHGGNTERMLNMCCGSGTLMIERLGMGRAASVTGVDISADALQCADANLRAAGHRSSVTLLRADCGALPLRTASVDAITADLPYGMLSGGGNISALYRVALTESARVAAPNASLVVITTRRRDLLAALGDVRCWRMRESIPLSIPYRSGYIKPQIYRLQRIQG